MKETKKAPFTEEYVQHLIHAVKVEGDKICDEYPDNFIFLTKYGGEITAQKFLSDPATDFDLRLICISIPDDLTQKRIIKRLEEKANPIPIELYFHSLDKYVVGEVGETGIFDSFEAIAYNLTQKETTTRIDSTLLSLYTFATLEFFTLRSNEQIVKRILTIAQNTKHPTASKISSFEQIDPRRIVESLQISRNDCIEYVHSFLRFFIDDLKKMQRLKQTDLNKDIYLSYLNRLSKYLIRIAFATAIQDSDFKALKTNYVTQLRSGRHAEQVHHDLIFKMKQNWLNIQCIRQMLDLAKNIRTNNSETRFSDKKIHDLELNELQATTTFIENIILLIAQQTGITQRKKGFENYLQDPIAEIAMLNLYRHEHELTTSKSKAFRTVSFRLGDKLFTNGQKSDHILYIPAYTADGFPNNGTYSILDNSGRLRHASLLRNKSFLGELGVLTGFPRSATLIANEPIEAKVIDGAMILQLVKQRRKNKNNPKKTKSLFHSVFTQANKENAFTLNETNESILTFSFLKYFSLEFIKYLNERINDGSTFFSSDIVTGNNKEEFNALEQYTLPYFAQIIEKVVKTRNIGTQKIETKDQQIRIDLNLPENKNYFYVILDCPYDGVTVKYDFNKNIQTQLKKNDFFGETALLQEEEQVKYSIIAPPNTTLLKINAQEFLEHTVTVDQTTVEISNNLGVSEKVALVLSELLFHIGAVDLKKLQVSFIAS